MYSATRDGAILAVGWAVLHALPIVLFETLGKGYTYAYCALVAGACLHTTLRLSSKGEI